MSLTKSHPATARELKHRTLTCLNKLSDRDTYAAAAAELESIAKTLPHETIPSFLSTISSTDASEKSPVRKQCVKLISLLSESHGDALSPHLSKLLSAVIRRLRDRDSAVRSACVDAITSISAHVTRPPFTSIAKPLLEALVTETELNSQIGAALCLSAAIEASPEPDGAYLRKLLVRIEKLLRSDGFRAKPALLTLVGSVIGAGGGSGGQIGRSLVRFLIDFTGSEDWAARKAAAEALVKLAVAEREVLVEFKGSCLKTIEARKCDKVKIVRETMNQLVEAWREIPDVSDDALPQESQTYSREDASDGRYPPGSKHSEMKKNNFPRPSPRDGSVATTARKQSPVDSGDKKQGQALFRKLDRKKPTNSKVETTPSSAGGHQDEKAKTTLTRPEAKRALFTKDADSKMLKAGGLRDGSRVFPCHDESSGSTLVVSKTKEKENDDLSLIRKQLVHIENQQSNLLDILQNFIGRSENGMHSLETRVHGLERALDNISYDLTMSNGRKSNAQTTCLNLPGTDFFSPKFWRKTQPRNSTSWFSSPRVTAPAAALARNTATTYNSFQPESRRMERGGGFIVNPLAEIHHGSDGNAESSGNGGGSINAQDAI